MDNGTTGHSIGTVARLTGISTHTLRVWERRYGLAPSRRTAAGHRQYTRTDLDHLKIIQQLLDKGHKIGAIARLPGSSLKLLIDEPEQTRQTAKCNATVVVVGQRLCDLIASHPSKFSSYSMQFFPEAPERWRTDPDFIPGELLLVDARLFPQPCVRQLVRMSNKKMLRGVAYLAPQLSRSAFAESTLDLVCEAPALNDVLQRLRTALVAVKNSNALFSSIDDFQLPQPSVHPHIFSDDQLNSLMEARNSFADGSSDQPSELLQISELAQKLKQFEALTQTQAADNWQDAAAQACIYNYTAKARHFIERALDTALQKHQSVG